MEIVQNVSKGENISVWGTKYYTDYVLIATNKIFYITSWKEIAVLLIESSCAAFFKTIRVISLIDEKQYVQCFFAVKHTLNSVEDYR